MRDKLLCPFCNKPLQPTLRQSDEYFCENYDCPQTSITWVGTSSLWKAFADTKQKLDELQKDYDLAIQHAKTMTETCLGYKAKLDEIKSDIDEMIAQSHDIGERFAEVVLCNLKNKIKDNDKDVK